MVNLTAYESAGSDAFDSRMCFWWSSDALACAEKLFPERP